MFDRDMWFGQESLALDEAPLLLERVVAPRRRHHHGYAKAATSWWMNLLCLDSQFQLDVFLAAALVLLLCLLLTMIMMEQY